MVVRIPPSSTTAVLGIALICELDGLIVEVIRDDYQAVTADKSPSLQRLVDEESVHKVENFLRELREQESSFGWEINLFIQNRMQTLHFAGGVAGGKMLILAAKSRSEVFEFYNELIHVQNDFVDSLRDIIAKQAKLAQRQIDRDSSFFDELTDLNNQLATLQRQLAKQNVELEQLNQIKNRFLGMAAHDLRGPLAAIMSFSEFVIDEAEDVLSDEHMRFLQTIRSSSAFMAALVTDLLDVSTIESGQLNLNLEYTNLAQIIQERIMINSILAKPKEISLNFSQEPEIPWLDIDPLKMGQVIDNLIGNAIKYSEPKTNIEIGLWQKGQEVFFAVKDQGTGIPADEIDKLFKFFGRTSVRSPHGEKSNGLGLAISHRIVQGHGGKIEVESHEGQGSTFTMSLPFGEEVSEV